MSSSQGKSRQEMESEIAAKVHKDPAFKQELLSNPKATLSKEYGFSIPDNIEVRVLEENPSTLYIVLPMVPADLEGSGELSEAALEAVAGGAGGYIANTKAGIIQTGTSC